MNDPRLRMPLTHQDDVRTVPHLEPVTAANAAPVQTFVPAAGDVLILLASFLLKIFALAAVSSTILSRGATS